MVRAKSTGQTELKWRTHGGARDGAGRPRTSRFVPHIARERLASRFPVHVTLRVHQRVLQCAVALLITAGPLGVATYARNFVWKDELTLWRDVVNKSVEKARPHHNLGDAHQAKGQLDDAVREYREAIRLDPALGEAHYNLGIVHQTRRQLDDAAGEYREEGRLTLGLPASAPRWRRGVRRLEGVRSGPRCPRPRLLDRRSDGPRGDAPATALIAGRT